MVEGYEGKKNKTRWQELVDPCLGLQDGDEVKLFEHTSWYTDGLDKEGMVKDNTLLWPSLSTISWNRKTETECLNEAK